VTDGTVKNQTTAAGSGGRASSSLRLRRRLRHGERDQRSPGLVFGTGSLGRWCRVARLL